MLDYASEDERLEFEWSLDALSGTRGVMGCTVATEEGLPLAARLQRELDGDALAAAAAAISRLGKKTLAGMSRGGLNTIVVDASKFRFLVRPIAVGYLLVVAEPDADVRLIAAEVSRAAPKLEEGAAALLGPAAGRQAIEAEDD